jgi:electron transfer flavoprotein-quinone oxidoreductase
MEFSAHLIPEHGHKGIPQLVTDGLLLVGDAAHFVNSSFYHEGTNLAMASGVMAAETILEAKQKGDFSRKALQRYEERLRESFVMKDLERYQGVPDFVAENPKFFQDYPELLIGMLREYFTISETPKEEVWRKILRMRRKNISLVKAFMEMKKFKDVLLGPGL